LLTAGASQARPTVRVRPTPAAPEAGSLLGAWDWLVSRFRSLEPREDREPRSGGDQTKAGCGMDPDGKPIPCK
jgi:hypothetical protein